MKWFFSVASLLAFLVLVRLAHGGIVNVCSTCSVKTVTEALRTNDTDLTLMVYGGPYTETGDVTRTENVTIVLVNSAVTLKANSSFGISRWTFLKNVSFSTADPSSISLTLIGVVIRVTGSTGIHPILKNNMNITSTVPETAFYVQEATWRQEAGTFVNVSVSGINAMGVRLQTDADWTSSGTFSITMQQPYSIGFYVDSSTWRLEQDVTIQVGSNSQGIYLQSSYLLQFGTVTANAGSNCGVVWAADSKWDQVGTLTVSAGADSIGVFLSNSSWTESADATITQDGPGTGISLVADSYYEQRGLLSIMPVGNGTGIFFASQGSKWNQLTDASISAMGNGTTGVDMQAGGEWIQTQIITFNSVDYPLRCSSLGFIPGWTSSGSVIVNGGGDPGVCAPGPFLVSNTTGIPQVPILLLNLSSPQVYLQPQDEKGVVQENSTIDITLGALTEINPASVPVQSATVDSAGTWVEAPVGGDSALTSFLYTCQLDVSGSDNSSVPQLELQYYLFKNTTSITLGNGFSFDIFPFSAKFTVKITGWPWKSSENKLVMRFQLRPAVSRVDAVSSQPGIQAFDLLSANNADIVRVRLLEAIELDGVLIDSGSVSFDIDENNSELVVRFAYFKESLIYDPDVGVLLGAQQGKGGGGDDNLGLIIGVSVAIPLAVLFVLGVIAAAVIIGIIRKKQVNAMDSVNFSGDDAL